MQRRGWIVGVAALLVVGIAVGAFFVGRSTPPAPPAPPTESDQLERGTASAGTIPTSGPGGLPQGFEQTPDGAASAAAAYRTFFDTQPPEAPVLSEALQTAVGAPPTEQQYQWADFKRGQGIRMDETAGAYAVTPKDSSHVTVHLWLPTTTPGVGEEWFWMTAEMVWRDGQWRWPALLKIAESAESQTYGKIPPSHTAALDLSAADRKQILQSVPDSRFPKDAPWQEWANAPR